MTHQLLGREDALVVGRGHEESASRVEGVPDHLEFALHRGGAQHDLAGAHLRGDTSVQGGAHIGGEEQAERHLLRVRQRPCVESTLDTGLAGDGLLTRGRPQLRQACRTVPLQIVPDLVIAEGSFDHRPLPIGRQAVEDRAGDVATFACGDGVECGDERLDLCSVVRGEELDRVTDLLREVQVGPDRLDLGGQCLEVISVLVASCHASTVGPIRQIRPRRVPASLVQASRRSRRLKG